MTIRLIIFFCFITTFLFAYNVTVQWNPSAGGIADGYKIYYGTTSGVYNTTSVVNNTNTTTTISNLISKKYYFAATAYNTNGETGFSNEASYELESITYIGIKLDYGTNLTSLTTKRIMAMSVTNTPNNFYSYSLIITNNPFTGTRPVDSNKYVYIGTLLKYGTNITKLNSVRIGLMTFTNAPSNQYYRSSLIITNHQF